MLERNTRQVNRIIANIFAVSTVAIFILVMCSYFGVFEFGKQYTLIILIAGLVITISPSILIHILPDHVMKYYMLILLSLFIGVLGTNNHIGIYITYALVPIFSCLYFDTKFIIRTSVFSYIVMAISVYMNSAGKYEVVYMGRPRMTIFLAYMLGFTIEYVIVCVILYDLVKRAKVMMFEKYNAEEENRIKSEFLSKVSHELRTPLNAIMGMTDVALRKDMDEEVRRCITVIQSSSDGLLEMVDDILDVSKMESGTLRKMAYDSRIDHVRDNVNENLILKTRETRVLLVDDNELNREVAKAILEPLDLVIDEACNGLEAFQMAMSAPYDVIFMDSNMPVMNGEEATAHIREAEDCVNQQVPIIAITADAVAGVRERLLASGMNDYIVKPIDLRTISEILQRYLPSDKIVFLHDNR